MTIKKFKGPKSLDQIREQCEAQDLILRRNRNDEFLSSFVVVSSLTAPDAAVYFSTVHGWFFGTTEDGTPFDSRKPPIDAPWFVALQEFFLEPLDAQAVAEQLKALGLEEVDRAGFLRIVESMASDLSLAENTTNLNLGEQVFEDTSPPILNALRTGDVIDDDKLDEGDEP